MYFLNMLVAPDYKCQTKKTNFQAYFQQYASKCPVQ